MTEPTTDTTKEGAGASPPSARLSARHAPGKRTGYGKALLLLLLAVLAGVIIGFGGAVIYFEKKMYRMPPRPDALATAIVDRLDSLVQLNPDERKRLAVIADTYMQEVESVRKKSFEEIRGVLDKMHGEVGEVVGPERAKIWKDYRDKRREERRHSRGKRPREHH